MYLSLTSSIDQLVGEIENHEATISATIKEHSRKLAAARVQLNRLRATQNRLSEKRSQLAQEDQRWSNRAKSESANDEDKALLCLQKRQQVREKIDRLTRNIAVYERTASKMEGNLVQREEEIRALKQKHELMRARQTSVDACSRLDDVNDTLVDDLETSFDRWETRIAQHELFDADYASPDELEQSYLRQEERDNLKAELAELMAEGNTEAKNKNQENNRENNHDKP
jgi:phage shock protein A